MPDAYPTATELAERLGAEGITAPAEAILESKVSAAITEFETATGYAPFLGAQIETERTFDPPTTTDFVNFGGGFWAVTSVEWGGRELTENTHYVLHPGDGAKRGYNRIELLCGWSSRRRSLVIQGNEGYAEDLPFDVYEAIMGRAMAMCLSTATPGVIGEPTSISQGSVSISGASDGGSKAKAFNEEFRQIVAKYLNIFP